MSPRGLVRWGPLLELFRAGRGAGTARRVSGGGPLDAGEVWVGARQCRRLEGRRYDVIQFRSATPSERQRCRSDSLGYGRLPGGGNPCTPSVLGGFFR